MRLRVRVLGVVGTALAATVAACSASPENPEPTSQDPRSQQQSALTPAAPTTPSAHAAAKTADGVRRTPFVHPRVSDGAPAGRASEPVAAGPGPNYCTPNFGFNPNLVYFGGQVLQNVAVVNVNWSSGVSSTVGTNMGPFYGSIIDSPYIDWLSEYDTVGLNGQDGQPGTTQGIARGTFVGTYSPTPANCNGPGKCTLTDGQVQAQLTSWINSKVIPTPSNGCDGFDRTIYMVNFPKGITIEGAAGAGPSCSAWCAYHFSFKYNGTVVPYAILPDLTNAGCLGNCGTNGVLLQDTTAVASHELMEAITDTDVGDIPNLATSGYSRPAGWGDDNCGEVGDICAFQYGTVNGWTVQQIWSQKNDACVVTPTPPAICTGAATPAGCRVCTCSDNGINCNGGTPWCETSKSNVDYGECVQCTMTSECPAGQTCVSSSSPATDDKCCAPITSCPAGQNCGSISNGCGGTLGCGSCTAPQTCGGGGQTNVCGCTPAKSCPAGDNCGSVPDGCGGIVTCGSCTAPQSCGGGGKQNVCGCTPIKACPAGDTCGTVPDGCGGTVTCGSSGGTCPVNSTCVSHKCTPTGGGDAGTGGDGGSSSGDAGSGGGDAGSGGHDAGTGAVDSGTTGGDAGTTGGDSGTAGSDSGTGGDDSGSAAGDDSGSTADSGGSGDDGGGFTPLDGSAGDDSSTADASGATDSGASGPTNDTSGCGCVTAGAPGEGGLPAGLLAAGGVGVLGGLRLRRRRR